MAEGYRGRMGRMTMTLLHGRTAVITGGAQGLGYAMGERFAEQGAKVVLADVDGDAAAAAAAELSSRGFPGSVTGAHCDVTAEESVQALVATAVETTGGLHVWVNNAGILRDATMRRMELDDFRAVIDVHLQGTWLGLKYASAHMRERGGGVIINMSSISGKVGNPGQTNYSAAKAGIVGMTKAAAKELGHLGIRVNAIQPGLIDTAMIATLKPEVMAQRLADIPLGRVGQPEEVANVALFLASELSSYLTGITIEVAGGRHI
jgi:3-oxoacyl-[acyl-carrier protein] reductase